MFETQGLDTHVVPQAHDENHGLGEGVVHAAPATLLVEVIGVVEGNLLGLAEAVGDGAAGVVGNLGLGVANDLAILNIETLDLRKLAVAALDELGHDSHLLGGINVEAGAGAVEGVVALAVRVEIATIGIASSSIAGGRVGATAGIALAGLLGEALAGMGSVGRGNLVGLPDIHLRAAGAVLANTGVLVAGGGLPLVGVGL